MTYESWRCTFQSSEQAARSAYAQVEALAARCKEHEQFRHQHRDCDQMGLENQQLRKKLAELEGPEPVAWVYDWQATEGLIRDWSTNNAAEIPEGATNIRPLFARQVPAEPVNARLLEAIKQLSFCAQTTGGTAGRDEGLCAAVGEAEKAIAAAEPASLTDEEIREELRVFGKGALVLRIARIIEAAVIRKNGLLREG